MSVLIKGVKKPKSCYELIDGELKRCPFVDADDDCVILREKGICTGTTWADMYRKCPLVEVLEPHGRLIDVNDVIKAKKTVGEKEQNIVAGFYKKGWNLAAEAIAKYAPTVIEAEGE